MTYKERVELYQHIEEDRSRPLIAYVTSPRKSASGQMAKDVIPELAHQILAIPEDKNRVDVLVVSNGGDPTVAWRIITMLRERFDSVAVLLPYTAYSAATLLALGADEIVMHPFSNLGPVDPQLTYTRPGPTDDSNPTVIKFGSEDLLNYFEFLREDVGISDQEELQSAFDLLGKDIGAVPIGVAKRSSQLSFSMGEKLLGLHMDDENEARTITESLNKSFYHHGYPVGRSEAKEIGLPVKRPDEDLERLIWEVWKSVEKEMKADQPFSPLEIVLDNEDVAALLDPVAQVQIPANLPPQMLQKSYQQVLQQIQIQQVEPVEYELFQAVLESTRCRSEFRTKGKINAVRQPNMNIAVNITPISQKWTFEENSGIVNDEPEGKADDEDNTSRT